MSTTPLDLVPGDSLGPFQLGSLLFNVLNHIRSYRQAYPSVKLLWDDTCPSTTPIHLVLSRPPLHLTFDSLSQRLSRIEVNPSSSSSPAPSEEGRSAGSWVSYRGKLLRDDRDDREDVVRTVRRVLGPTFGSSLLNGRDEEDQGEEEEMLSYPGVTLGVTEKGSRLNRIILTPLPTNTTTMKSVDQAWLYPELPPSPSIASGDLRLAEINIDPTTRRPTSVELHFHSSQRGGGEPINPVKLEIGFTTSEDILCDLGSAVRSFWKEDDRMSIHNTSSHSSSSTDPSLALNPYFLSYPHLGLTLMLQPSSSSSKGGGGKEHILEKILLHSNLPGQSNFGRTSRSISKFVIDVVADENEEEFSIGVEEKFGKIKEFLKTGGRRGEGNSSSSTVDSTTQSSLPTPVPIPLITSTESTTNKKNNKKKSKTPSSALKEIDLLGDSSLLGSTTPSSSSSSSSSPSGSPQFLMGGGRTSSPSPLRNEMIETPPSSDKRERKKTEEAEVENWDEKPMLLDRTAVEMMMYETNTGGGSSGDGGGGKGRITEIYGLPGIAFEVTTQSRDIETVWLF